ncbi:MAG: hypothetical protein ABI587_16215 [Gemmatimonadales bacterium]
MSLRLLAALTLCVAACHQNNGAGSPPPSGGDPTTATVHEVLTKPALVGRILNVTGRCLGYSAPFLAKGPSPLTRSDWQLEDQGEAVWVSGAMPTGCSATQPAVSPSTISALVAQDTLPILGGNGPSPRQYLVRQ